MIGLTFVALVSDKYKSVFDTNLKLSPAISDNGKNELIVINDFSVERSCVSLNKAIDVSGNDVIVFVQSDVYLPEHWDTKLRDIINSIEENCANWGVLGIFGIAKNNEYAGHVYSNGLQRELGRPGPPVEAASIDETLFVLNKKTGVRFDDCFPYLSLYGNDLMIQTSEKGYKNYIFSDFLVHNSLTIVRYQKGTNESVEYFRCKWPQKLPFRTPYLTVYPEKWKNLYHIKKYELLQSIRRKRKVIKVRSSNPSSIRSIYSCNSNR